MVPEYILVWFSLVSSRQQRPVPLWLPIHGSRGISVAKKSTSQATSGDAVMVSRTSCQQLMLVRRGSSCIIDYGNSQYSERYIRPSCVGFQYMRHVPSHESLAKLFHHDHGKQGLSPLLRQVLWLRPLRKASDAPSGTFDSVNIPKSVIPVIMAGYCVVLC